MTVRRELTALIKQRAAELGFTACGIARAEAVDSAVRHEFEEWIASGANGTMAYMAGNMEKRMNPTLLVEGCRSIIVVALNYFPEQSSPRISCYAQGKDYHRIVKDKLFTLLEFINSITPATGRAFCDSAPVLERYWAVKAGLGWCGKNRQLIISNCGTHFFLGELLVDVELEYDNPFTGNFCGNCNACIENCPTGALSTNAIDARRCLSYLTIEYRGELPTTAGAHLKECFYGCDRCQRVCPHNRFATPTEEKQLAASADLLAMQRDDWRRLTKEQFDTLFKESAVQRCGYVQFMRNIKAADTDY